MRRSRRERRRRCGAPKYWVVNTIHPIDDLESPTLGFPDLFPTWSSLLLPFHLRRQPQGGVSYCAGGDKVLTCYQLVQGLVDDDENCSFVRLSDFVLSKRLYEDLCYPRRTPKRIKLLATLHYVRSKTRSCAYIASVHMTLYQMA